MLFECVCVCSANAARLFVRKEKRKVIFLFLSLPARLCAALKCILRSPLKSTAWLVQTLLRWSFVCGRLLSLPSHLLKLLLAQLFMLKLLLVLICFQQFLLFTSQTNKIFVLGSILYYIFKNVIEYGYSQISNSLFRLLV